MWMEHAKSLGYHKKKKNVQIMSIVQELHAKGIETVSIKSYKKLPQV